MQACSLGLVELGFRVRDKVRVSVRDRAGVRVDDGLRVSTFYFSVTLAARIPAGPHLTHSPKFTYNVVRFSSIAL